MNTFSNRLKNLRESLGYSKTKVANLVGVGLSTYANWEYGYNDPDMDTLNKLANVLGTTTDFLTGRTYNSIPYENKTNISDLDDMLDNAESFDGKPMTDSDREAIRSFLQGRFSNN